MMSNSDFLPHTSPPSPTTPLAQGKLTTAVPDISLIQDDNNSLLTNLKNNSNRDESIKTNKYPHDLRLKFYQIVQSNSKRNSVKVQSKVNPRCSLPQNNVVSVETKNNLISPITERMSTSRRNHMMRQVHHQDNQAKNIQRYCPSDTVSYSNSDCVHNRRNNNDIKKLFALVEGQSQQLEALKLQIKTLLVNLNKFHDNITKAPSQVIDNEVKSLEPIQCQQKQKYSEETREVSARNQVSIGVMTSFEFTIRNNVHHLDNNISPIKNPSPLKEIHEKIPVETLTSPLEKIIEKSESQFSRPSVHLDINSHRKAPDVDNKIDDCIENGVDESLRTSTKVGWTFYNNVVCQVNEILHNSNKPSSPHTSCDIQNSQKHQIQALGAAFNDITNAITSNISDKIIAFDSTYYPRVNYQTNIVQTSTSTSDTNASIHMKALALKYLGNKIITRDNTQQPINELNKTNSMLDLILENTMSLSTRNYMDKHKLMDNEPVMIENPKVQEQILDISILKRQPKLL